jgi:hypothetical protein
MGAGRWRVDLRAMTVAKSFAIGVVKVLCPSPRQFRILHRVARGVNCIEC